MTFNDALTRVCNRTNKNSSDAVVAARIKNHINDVCQEQWDGFKWSFRKREFPLITTADVTTGTMTATNGSPTVTASSAVFDSTVHVGAWIRFTADTTIAWYKILAVGSTTSVTLDANYQGTTGASKAYELKRTTYLMPTEVWDISDLEVTFNRNFLPLGTTNDARFGPPQVNGSGAPSSYGLYDVDFKGATYTTGTVSITVNTKTLTGVGTTWLTNVLAGDSVTLGTDTNTYTVYSVDSNTQLTLYNNVTVAQAAATYTVSRAFQRSIRLDPTADKAYVIVLGGLRKYAYLVGNNDTNELLLRYASAVIEGAVWRELGSSPDPREDSNFQKAQMFWANARGEDHMLTQRSSSAPIWTSRISGDGL